MGHKKRNTFSAFKFKDNLFCFLKRYSINQNFKLYL